MMFISLHFSVSSLCKVNQLKQTKLRIVMGNLYVPVQCELSFLLYWGEAHWSHCVIGGAFMPCSIHSSMVTNSIRRKCKGMFWLENSKCCCSIVSPLESFSWDPVSRESWAYRLSDLSTDVAVIVLCFVSHAVTHSKLTLSWGTH